MSGITAVSGAISNYFNSMVASGSRAVRRVSDLLEDGYDAIMGEESSGGLVACGFIANEMAPDLDGGADAGIDGDVDAGVFCENSPGNFTLESPADAATNVALSPLMNWSDSTDPDSGDIVTYRLLLDTNSSLSSATEYADITASQFTIPTTLYNDQIYYWQVIASDRCDQETASAVFSFTTIPVCANPPSAVTLQTPSDGATDVPMTSNLDFDWADATDPDVGDTVRYTFQLHTSNDFTSPLIEVTDLTSSTHTVDALNDLQYNTTYHWRVVTYDACNNPVPSSTVFSFTTESECVAQTPIVETAFVQGTYTDVDNTSMQSSLTDSSIFLARNWSGGWYASDGLPTVATPSWTPAGTATPPSSTVVDPTSSEDALRIDTWTGDTNDSLYYTLGTFTPAMSNPTGWSIQWRNRLEALASDNSGGECFLGVIDGTWEGGVGLTSSTVIELLSSSTYGFTTTTKMNTYRFEGQGTNFRVYVNENLQIIGTFASANTSAPQIRFGDIYAAQDADSYWNHVVWYTGSDHVPYLTSGEYISQVFDLGTALNNLGSTASLTLTITEPAATSISFETRTGGTATPDGSWSTWVAVSGMGHIINSPAERYLQIKATLTTADTAETPVVDEYQINYCTY